MPLNLDYSNCERCGARFPVSPGDLKRGRGKYCSRACYFKSRVGIVRSDRGRKTETRECPVCVTQFKVGGRGHGNKRQVFCSIACRNLARYRRSNRAKDLCEVDAAHLAGLVEGEGSIMLQMRRDVVALRILICNTNKDLLKRVLDVTGVGGIVTSPRQSPRHKDAGWWQTNAEGAESVLKQIRPFMWMKTEQADLALETIERLRNPKLKADRSWHLEYCERMRRLNKRGAHKIEWKQSMLALEAEAD